METLAAFASLVLLAASASGQGQIFFNNRVIGQVVAPVYGVNPYNPTVRLSGNATTNGGNQSYSGFSLLSGTNFTAQLWYGPVGASMEALQPVTGPAGTVPFRSTAATAGFIQNSASAATLDGIPFDSQAALQMRVWDNRGGLIGSWAAAIAFGAAYGYSEIFTSPILVPPPDVPPSMVGLTSFSILGTVVPEPSIVALGLVGMIALLFRRLRT